MTSYKPEVRTFGEQSFHGNALRFATTEEAEAYVLDFMMRWTLVEETRATACDDPVTHAWVEGVLVTHACVEGVLVSTAAQQARLRVREVALDLLEALEGLAAVTDHSEWLVAARATVAILAGERGLR